MKKPQAGGKSPAAKKPAKKKANKGQAAADRAAKAKSASAGTKPVKKGSAPEPQVKKFPSRGTIKGVMDPVQTHLNRAATESGKARELIAEGKRTKGIDPEIFGYVRKLIMKGQRDPQALRSYLDARAHYEREMKIEELAGDSLFSYQTAEDNESTDNNDASDQSQESGEAAEQSGGVVDLGAHRAASTAH